MKRGDDFEFEIQIENKGVAPFYFQWPLVIYFIDEQKNTAVEMKTDIDIQEWFPGTWSETGSILIPENSETGMYNVKLAVHDPQTNKPGLLFANTNKDTSARYLVGRVSVN